MEELKALVNDAKPGTGEIARVLANAAFTPRHAGFTSLMQMVSKAKQPEKALELFGAMQSVAGISPNAYTYSALISALGKAGQWQRAEQFFKELQARAARDNTFRANTVTWAALISAYERGGQVQKALDAFEAQMRDGVEPDIITFSSLISACERSGRMPEAVSLLDRMHAAGVAAGPALYAGVIGSCEDPGTATEVFLGMQCAGVVPSEGAVARLLGSLSSSWRRVDALTLLRGAVAAGYRLPAASYLGVLRMAAGLGDEPGARFAYDAMRHAGHVREEAGWLLGQAHARRAELDAAAAAAAPARAAGEVAVAEPAAPAAGAEYTAASFEAAAAAKAAAAEAAPAGAPAGLDGRTPP